jgi:hypothetical protein
VLSVGKQAISDFPTVAAADAVEYSVNTLMRAGDRIGNYKTGETRTVVVSEEKNQGKRRLWFC